MAAVLEHLRGRLPDAIVANGAGNYTVWVHRFWQYSRYRSQLAPLSGAMGYGVPAALAGKLVHPERPGRRVRGRRLLPDVRARSSRRWSPTISRSS